MTPVASIENLTQNAAYCSRIERAAGSFQKTAMFYQRNGYSLDSQDIITNLAKEDAALLEQSSAVQTLLHKSHSYSETLRPKATIIRQDSTNGRIATSITAETHVDNINFQPINRTSRTASAFILESGDSENYYSNNNNNTTNNNNNNIDNIDVDSDMVFVGTGNDIVDIGDEEEDACLLPINSQSSSPSRRVNNLRRHYGKSSVLGNSSQRASVCYRIYAFITRNWYLNYLVPLTILIALMFVAYLTRDYAKRLLYWIETQNPWVIFAIFMFLFTVVSFPIVVGYFVLMITAGYLFGFFKGLVTVILGANVGIALAHLTIKSLRHRIPMHRIIKNETGRAILRVISGPRAFRVVLFTRLTPIPFGLQNAIFGVSTINPRIYHAATFLGLLPAQTINVYLGSTLRSMHEVLNSHGTAVTGYISFGIEVVCGVALMFWVVQKARKELSETLLDCSSTENKLINIQV